MEQDKKLEVEVDIANSKLWSISDAIIFVIANTLFVSILYGFGLELEFFDSLIAVLTITTSVVVFSKAGSILYNAKFKK